MSFSPDINKQAREVIFSRRLQRSNHLSLTFNGASVTLSGIQKHLGMFLDSWLQWVAGYLGLALVFVWGNAQSWCGVEGGGGGLFRFIGILLLVSVKLSFWRGDCALGYDSMEFRQFPHIS